MSSRRSLPAVVRAKPIHISTGRTWIPKQEDQHQSDKCVTKIRIISYNILHDSLDNAHHFSHCRKHVLNWDFRGHVINEELRNYKADIIVLQEINRCNTNFLTENLGENYTGVFLPKCYSSHGCAVIHNKTVLTLKGTKLIRLNKYKGNVAIPKNLQLKAEERNNIAVVATFTFVDAEELGPMIVATPHLFWNPLHTDVKLFQAITLMSELDKIVESTGKTYKVNKEDVHVIIAGDFNSVPQSGVMKFMKERHILSKHDDFLNAFKEYVPTNFSYDLDLKSAYDGELKCTFLAKHFKGVIDHIFYSTKKMQLVNILGPVPQEWLRYYRHWKFPNENFPSDHFAVGADIDLHGEEVKVVDKNAQTDVNSNITSGRSMSTQDFDTLNDDLFWNGYRPENTEPAVPGTTRYRRFSVG